MNIKELIKLRSDQLNNENRPIIKEQLIKDFEFMSFQEVADFYGVSVEKIQSLRYILDIDEKSCWGWDKRKLLTEEEKRKFENWNILKSIVGKEITTFHLGSFIESKCQSRFIQLGYEIFIPLNESSEVDFISSINGSFEIIQCKNCNFDGEKVSINGTKHSNLENIKYRNIDFIVSYIMFIDIFIKIPYSKFDNKSGLTLRVKERMSKHHDNPEYLEDYLF